MRRAFGAYQKHHKFIIVELGTTDAQHCTAQNFVAHLHHLRVHHYFGAVVDAFAELNFGRDCIRALHQPLDALQGVDHIGGFRIFGFISGLYGGGLL